MGRFALIMILFSPSLVFAEEILVPPQEKYELGLLFISYLEKGDEVAQGKGLILLIDPELTKPRFPEAILSLHLDIVRDNGEYEDVLLLTVKCDSSNWINRENADPAEKNPFPAMVENECFELNYEYFCKEDLQDRQYKCHEYHTFGLPLKDFKRWSQATQIELRPGNISVILDKEDLEYFQLALANLPRGKFGSYTIKTDPVLEAKWQIEKAEIAAEIARQEELNDQKRQQKNARDSLHVIERLAKKNKSLAIQKLKDLIQKYPKTDAAEDAQKLIEELQ